MGLSRAEFFRLLGVIEGPSPKIDKLVEESYERFEHIDWHKESKSPHGRVWNTSFHASSFPGGEDQLRCGRKALYSLMNIPGERFSPRSRAIMEQGRAAERQIAYRMGHAGLTLSGSVSLHHDVDGKQTNFSDPRHWLTGSVDLVLDIRSLRSDWNRVVPTDVKSKDDKGLLKLKLGEKEPESGYIAQVMAYGHLCRLYHADMGWGDLGLGEAEGGVIYYVSRNNPRDTWEYWVDWDQAYVEIGLVRLREWIEFFNEGRLPERDKKWRWTEEPCKWCDFKKLCKEDIKNDHDKLVDSVTVEYARTRNAGYDPAAVMDDVRQSWKEKEHGQDEHRSRGDRPAGRGLSAVHDGGGVRREGEESGSLPEAANA